MLKFLFDTSYHIVQGGKLTVRLSFFVAIQTNAVIPGVI